MVIYKNLLNIKPVLNLNHIIFFNRILLSVFFWNIVEGYEERHIYNVRCEDQGLMAVRLPRQENLSKKIFMDFLTEP